MEASCGQAGRVTRGVHVGVLLDAEAGPHDVHEGVGVGEARGHDVHVGFAEEGLGVRSHGCCGVGATMYGSGCRMGKPGAATWFTWVLRGWGKPGPPHGSRGSCGEEKPGGPDVHNKRRGMGKPRGTMLRWVCCGMGKPRGHDVHMGVLRDGQAQGPRRSRGCDAGWGSPGDDVHVVLWDGEERRGL